MTVISGFVPSPGRILRMDPAFNGIPYMVPSGAVKPFCHYKKMREVSQG